MNKPFKQAALFLCLLLFVYSSLSAVETLKIPDYSHNLSFSDQKIVYLTKGDDLKYKDPSYNDSGWVKTSLPSSWKDIYPEYNGICWYRIHIAFPDKLPDHAVGVRLGVITNTDEVYFNGVLIGRSGSIENLKDAAYDKKRVYEIPTPLIHPGSDNVLAIRVKGIFPYANGPSAGTFVIGGYSNLLSTTLISNFLQMFFVVVYIVVAGYFFLFFIRRRKDKENLYFALFSLAMGIYFALRTQSKYLLDADFFLFKKIEYLMLASVVPLFLEFLIRFFKKKHMLFHYIFFGLSIVNFIFFLITGSYTLWDSYNQFVQLPIWGLGVILSFVILVQNFRKELDARLILYATIILVLTLINDVLLNMSLYQFPRLTSYGFLFFIIAIGGVLSNNFVRLHKKVELLNTDLENLVLQRTEALNSTVENLETAKKETDNLLENVQEGIFILDQDLNIGDHHSKMFETIFEEEELGGKNIVEFLSTIVDSKTAEQAQDFLTIALEKKLSTKRLNKLNPLDEIKVVLTKEDKRIEKHVRFRFNRIGEKGHYSHILGTVQDISEEKILEDKIKKSEEKAEKEMELLLNILHLEPAVIKTFLEEAEEDITSVKKALESANFTKDLRGLLNSVYRSVHSIKGNASVLGLDMFTKQAHQFEEKIQDLFEKETLVPLDLLDLLYYIVGINDALTQVETLLKKITGFQSEFGSGSGVIDQKKLLMQTAKDLAKRVSERESKSVTVNFKQFDIPIDGSVHIPTVKKILVQLIKNAITHGIETPAERAAAGKSEMGEITVSAQASDSKIVISVLDNGRGLQIEKLKIKAVESGLYSQNEIDTWPLKKLGKLLFLPGLSTQKEANIDAGRGMGMDIVRHTVQKAGGKIGLSFVQGEQTKFTITIPREDQSKL